jgi:Uma2 family endonuclease
MSADLSAASLAAPVVDEPLFEVIDGQRVELPPMGAFEGSLASLLAFHINQFAEEAIGLAVVEVLFDLQIGRKRRPDVAFVRYDRWPKRRRIPPGDAWVVIPNLAVEIVSPSNTHREIIDKITDYFRAGVQLVWVIDAAHAQVYVYTSPKQVQVLDEHDALDGADVIPGFQLSLSTLFDVQAEEEQ